MVPFAVWYAVVWAVLVFSGMAAWLETLINRAIERP